MYPVTPYIMPLLLSAASCLSLAIGAWHRRTVPGATALTMMLAAIVVWDLAYALELGSGDLQAKLFWSKFEYLGIEAVPPAWLLFALQYTGRDRWMRSRNVLALCVEPLVTLSLVWTNEAHGLIWSHVELSNVGPFPTLLVAHGPWFWVHAAYCYALLLITTGLLFWAIFRTPRHYHGQVGAVLIAVMVGWAANAAYIFGLNPVPGLDPTPFGSTVSVLALSLGLTRLRLLNLFMGILPLARDAVLSGMADGVIVLDRANLIVDMNPAARRMLGVSPKEVIGKPAGEAFRDQAGLLPLHSVDHSEAHLEIALGGPAEGRCYDLLVSPLTGWNGGQHGRLAVFRDITERKRAERALQHQALHDALTDLPNGTLLHNQLRQACLAAERGDRSFALLVMDLDRFRDLKNTLGHRFADLLLQQVGSRLREGLRESDLIARLGGDEFAVLLDGADEQHALYVTDRLSQSLRRSFVVEGYRLDVGVSVGIAIGPVHGTDADVLLRRADVAMYWAKRTGVGYSVYSLEQDPYSADRLELLGDLRSAIERDELALHYQPQVAFESRHVVQFEALARWRHPRRGQIPPNQFIPLAEQTGLIKPLTMWVLRSALRQCREWREAGLQIPVAVNLSARSLRDPSLVKDIAGILESCKVEPACLEVELTESNVMEDPARAVELLTDLSAMGVRIAVDDFGTGYSSLAYLARLPVNEIKIDKSFILTMKTAANDEAIVRSTINLGHDLGLAVVAEGVEDQTTWDRLASLGCDTGQGYHLSHPLPVSDVTNWLRNSPWDTANLMQLPGKDRLRRVM